MAPGPDGSLVPLDLRELGAHLPVIRQLPVALTLATFPDPIDSAGMGTSDWLDIADAIIDHAPGHAGVVVLHGTDTMAYTASALSLLLEGIDIPKHMVLTDRHAPDEVRRLMQEDLVGELSVN
jgi:L-asparaginase